MRPLPQVGASLLHGGNMLIYHAGITPKALNLYQKIKPGVKVNALISFARLDKKARQLIQNNRCNLNSLILDSGTWSLNRRERNSGKKPTLESYEIYLCSSSKKFDFYFNYDEDFSTKGFETNMANQAILEHHKLKPIPVVHNCYGEEIGQYIRDGHEIVAIGSGELSYASIGDLFFIIQGIYRHGIKIHLLGCTDYRKLACVPAYSCDSSTWTQFGGKGGILFWNPDSLAWNKTEQIYFDYNIPRKKMNKHITEYPNKGALEKYLDRELRITIDDLIGDQKLLYRQIVNLHYFTILEGEINKRHKEQNFSFDF